MVPQQGRRVDGLRPGIDVVRPDDGDYDENDIELWSQDPSLLLRLV